MIVSDTDDSAFGRIETHFVTLKSRVHLLLFCSSSILVLASWIFCNTAREPSVTCIRDESDSARLVGDDSSFIKEYSFIKYAD